MNRLEKTWVADQAVLKSKELTSQALPCLTLTDFHEVSRPFRLAFLFHAQY
jgi:hypothetical protein